jgi:hypothetical protein
MDWIITVISWACIGVLWINAEPAIRFREWLYKNKDKEVWHWRLINCCLCSSFWIALIATGNILDAAVISVLAELVCRKLNGGSL